MVSLTMRYRENIIYLQLCLIQTQTQTQIQTQIQIFCRKSGCVN